MAKKKVVCPGSGRSVGGTFSSNPKVDCPRCQKRVGVMHTGKIRKHESFQTVK